ncbi:hypothetical protein QCA50_004588 [Cerrena zonata]|uniref:Uncharacterized protein n=1 Tax=Cerrena zonata TaxID=2478898 RepID=A0AAW0GJW4_9APHY
MSAIASSSGVSVPAATVSSLPNSGYASPASSYYSPSSKPSTPKPKVKPVNVFSNDGSFLERFQQLKKDEEEKKKQEDALERKRQFDNRFKNRGKRPPPTESDSTSTTEPLSKKSKSEEPLTQYEKEVKNYSGGGRGLKDDGSGVRPLVK